MSQMHNYTVIQDIDPTGELTGERGKILTDRRENLSCVSVQDRHSRYPEVMVLNRILRKDL